MSCHLDGEPVDKRRRSLSLWTTPPGNGQDGAVSERMSIRQPVSRAASRAFCPSRPMASDSW